MSEKRFTSFIEDDGYWIRDESDFKIIATGLKLGVALNLRAYLNELNDENKEFQVQCNLLREQANEFHRIARENVNRAGQLEKENKELKEKQLQDANVYAPSKKSYRLIG